MFNIDQFKLFLISLFFLTGSMCFAQEEKSSEYHFYRANLLYEKGNYDEAIAEYKKLNEKSLESGNFYYNIGNCYFKKGDLGKSILNYEKAKKILPRDKDLIANYEYAKSNIEIKSIEPKSLWIIKEVDNFFEQFTIDEITKVLFVFYIILLIVTGVCIVLRIPTVKKVMVISVPAILVLCNFISLSKRVDQINKEAIVIENKIEAKFEPFEKAATHFILYEGVKVTILSLNGNWCKIKRIDNKIGWINKDQLSII